LTLSRLGFARRPTLLAAVVVAALFLVSCGTDQPAQPTALAGPTSPMSDPSVTPQALATAAAITPNSPAAPATFMLEMETATPSATASLATPTGTPPAILPETGVTPTPGTCRPTEADQLGPFYEPTAPERNSVGQGHVLSGVIRSGVDCSPIVGVRIELWMANANAVYDDAHRATMFSDQAGAYRFESNVPVPYSGRPPHIHIMVTAEGYRLLVTQYYPPAGSTSGTFDLVLTPGP